jgi:hypothetical protein
VTLIAETQDEAAAFMVSQNTGRELVNAILFDTEDAPPEIRTLAKQLYGAYLMFDEAQDAAKVLRELRDMPPAGQA